MSNSIDLPQIELQKQPIEYLVMSGGGAKGGIYTGVHKALHDSGVLLNTKGIAGSSAGAISAALIATGMSPEAFKKTANEQNFGDLLGEGIIPIKAIPFQKDGIPLYELLDKVIRSNIKDFLDNADINELSHTRLQAVIKEREESDNNLAEQMSTLQYTFNEIENLVKLKASFKKEEDLGEIDDKIKLLKDTKSRLEVTVEDLSDKIKYLSNNFTRLKEITQNPELEKQRLLNKCLPGGKICFKDLATMRLLDPQKFKDLHVTAVKESNGELHIFNAESNPDVEIALACRASASIPRVFKSVEIDGEKYVDGGFRDNTPYKAFSKKRSAHDSDVEDITGDHAKLVDAYQKKKTLAFVFANASSKEALYSSKETVGDNPWKIQQFIRGIINALSRKKQAAVSKNNHPLKQSQEESTQHHNDTKKVKISFWKKIATIIMTKLSGVSGKHSYNETLEEGYTKMRENDQNSALLDTGKVGTLSFEDAQKHKDILHSEGYISTMNHLHNFNSGSIKKDPNIALKSFMQEVYKQVEQTKPNRLWHSKVHGTNSSQKALLEFSISSIKWHNRPQEEVLKEYIKTALLITTKKPGEKNWSANSPSALSMINVLNNNTTPDSVKNIFAKVLGKEPLDMVNRKDFNKKDLESFIKQKIHAPTIDTKELGVSR